MRIAQIAPLAESVPPKLYGGTERVVSWLTEELVRQGHDVTLFASGDSVTRAKLIACTQQALRLDPGVTDPLPAHLLMLGLVRRHAHQFDILHFHIDLLQFPLLAGVTTPAITTLHGRQDLPDLPGFYRAFPNQPLVSISDNQRQPLPPLNWIATIPHGLPRGLLGFRAAPDREPYLVFLGRISPEKRPDRAIEIAARAGMPLRIAAKISADDQSYWQTRIEPMIRATPGVTYLGEIAEQEKSALLGGAAGLLFPIDWPEPFGLVMIEAMACGTPVIAWPRGSVPEVVEPGGTGFLVESIPEAVEATRLLATLDRRAIRASFERRFEVTRMARAYVAAYQTVVEAHSRAPLDSRRMSSWEQSRERASRCGSRKPYADLG